MYKGRRGNRGGGSVSTSVSLERNDVANVELLTKRLGMNRSQLFAFALDMLTVALDAGVNAVAQKMHETARSGDTPPETGASDELAS